MVPSNVVYFQIVKPVDAVGAKVLKDVIKLKVLRKDKSSFVVSMSHVNKEPQLDLTTHRGGGNRSQRRERKNRVTA